VPRPVARAERHLVPPAAAEIRRFLHADLRVEPLRLAGNARRESFGAGFFGPAGSPDLDLLGLVNTAHAALGQCHRHRSKSPGNGTASTEASFSFWRIPGIDCHEDKAMEYTLEIGFSAW
jgi:hypothetical protein